MAEKDKAELQKIKELVEMMIANDLVEVEIVEGENKIHLKRPQPQQAHTITTVPMMAPAMGSMPVGAPAAAVEAAKKEDNLLDITSPIVGTFYSAPSPDSEPYVKVGSDVGADTVVSLIEAMKVMNEIKAGLNGTIAKVMVSNGQAVEYGQVLFKVKPN